MKNYRLYYAEPYGYDDGDSQSVGHEVLWNSEELRFQAKNDGAAKRIAKNFLTEKFFIDKETFHRKGRLLIEERNVGLS